MITAVVLSYHVGVVLLAYRLGRNSAGYGIATFLIGVAVFQLLMNGPGSFIDPSGCDYGHAVQTC